VGRTHAPRRSLSPDALAALIRLGSLTTDTDTDTDDERETEHDDADH
jgi:hypothetical protein